MAKVYQNKNSNNHFISKTRIEHNNIVVGGLISESFPSHATADKFLLLRVLPSLTTGFLSTLCSAAERDGKRKVIEGINGSGVIYLKKNGLGCEVIPAVTSVCTWRRYGSAVGSGIYFRTGFGYDDGRLLRANFFVLKHSNTMNDSLSYQKLILVIRKYTERLYTSLFMYTNEPWLNH